MPWTALKPDHLCAELPFSVQPLIDSLPSARASIGRLKHKKHTPQYNMAELGDEDLVDYEEVSATQRSICHLPTTRDVWPLDLHATRPPPPPSRPPSPRQDEAVEEGGKTEEVKKCVPRRSTAVYGAATSA